MPRLRQRFPFPVLRQPEVDQPTNALAVDVQRYLADEPVLACPPSTTYRLRKFALRNRRALATAAVVAVAALVGVGALVVGTVLVWRANTELRESVARERRET